MTPQTPDDAVRSAAEALRDPRPDARQSALTKLMELYVSGEPGTSVTNPDVAQAVLPNAKLALADQDPGIRITGIHAIELLATDAADSIPDLVLALSDPVEAARIAALEALAEFGPRAAQAAPSVAERLANAPTPEERAAAACALGNFRTPGDHLDALLHALFNDAPIVQADAAHALGFALEDERAELRDRVSLALRRLARAT
jgi:HEAT repeat protein